MEASKQPRVTWIDVVKGIAMILVIVSHVGFGKPVGSILFSFHMPLFFILSGMTYSPAKDWKSLPRKVWRNFRGLILPIVVVMILQSAFNLIKAHSFSISAYWENLKLMFTTRLFWASGTIVSNDKVASIGIFWFVFSLFWGKIIIDLFSLLFEKKNVLYLCAATAILTVYLGEGVFLPQNMDVTLVAVFFIAAGMTAREHLEWIARNKVWLFLVSMALWVFGFNQNAVIQMAARQYREGMLCIFTALAGSFAICCVGKALTANPILCKALSFVGRHTLLMLILHHLFWGYSYLWEASNPVLTSLKRVALNLLLTSVLVLVSSGLRLLMKKVTQRKVFPSA